MDNNLKTRKILEYSDLVQKAPGSLDEPLVSVTAFDSTIATQYIKTDMLPITGETIYVRRSIAKKLATIEKKLKKIEYRLKIVYGYRHPDVQKKYFEERRAIISAKYPSLTPGSELDGYTHKFVAVPSIAGHPAAAAVDVTIIRSDGTEIDMGTKIADYSNENKIQTFSNLITEEQKGNRKLLHDLMVQEEFAPFYGEWWHFSYGDREWAAFYNKKALYGAIDFKNIAG